MLITKQAELKKVIKVGRHHLVLLLLFILALLLDTTKLQAETVTPTPEQLASYQAAPETERLKLLVFLINHGQAALSQKLLGQFPFTGPFAANRTLFIEGMILSSRGKFSAACAKYRKALADDPSLSMVRSELAKTLIAMGETESAKHHLKLLMAEAPNMDEANKVKSFIETLSAKHPFTYNTYISLAPSSNINNGSKIKKTVYENGYTEEISNKYRKKSGVGFSTGFNAGYTKRLGDDFTFVSATGGNANIYTHHDYNTYSLSQSAELRLHIRKGYLSLGAIASGNIQKDTTENKEYRSEWGYKSYYAYGPRLAFQKSLTPKDQINGSFVHEWRNYRAKEFDHGRAYLVDAGWEHLFSSSFGATLSLGFDRIKTSSPWEDYKAYSTGLGLYKELPHGVTANLYGGFRYAKFDKEMPPFFLKKRHDHRYTGALTLTKRDWNIWGYAPSLNYTYIYNYSNFSMYHFDSNSVDVRLTKNF